MLIEAGTGVSVANGDPRLKEVADDICEDCLDDGFYKWLVKNDIIDEDIKI
jgi:hydroxymethylpyrimidine pyrophosphatase-like HAD family hydrolase